MPVLETKSAFGPPPIARIAGQTAAEAALTSLAEDMRQARETGRLVQALALDDIDEGHLVRDRIRVDDEEMAALEASLSARGQQVPIEVVDLGPDRAGGRYGLISGWRRLTALRRLAESDPERFGTVLAVLRRPESAAEAYRAMVEENEIRVGLSYYERARIVARSAGQGVFRDENAALYGLFGSASRGKRSKIGSFLKIHDALEDRLRFPAAISERLGLRLARALEDEGFATRLRDRLRKTPAEDIAAELAVLERALAAPGGDEPAGTPEAAAKPAAAREAEAGAEPGPPVRLRATGSGLLLSGPGVTVEFRAELEAWLAGRG